jgi:segregation and condensation protein A
MQLSIEPFKVASPEFAGPMDLLVYLVRKRELDVAYISVSAIASDYLNWLEKTDVVDLDNAGDYLLLAATLLHFKADELLAIGEPEITEAELTEAFKERSLVDLLALRASVQKLAELEEHQIGLFDRGVVEVGGLEEELVGQALSDVSLYDIAMAFRDLIENLPVEPTHVIEKIPFTIEGQMAFILSYFSHAKRIAFDKLAAALETRLAVVMTFLAMLELIRLKRVAVRQQETFGPLWLVLREKVNA